MRAWCPRRPTSLPSSRLRRAEELSKKRQLFSRSDTRGRLHRDPFPMEGAAYRPPETERHGAGDRRVAGPSIIVNESTVRDTRRDDDEARPDPEDPARLRCRAAG